MLRSLFVGAITLALAATSVLGQDTHKLAPVACRSRELLGRGGAGQKRSYAITSMTSRELSVRGGAGPLDVDVTAKAATIFFDVYGSMCLLFPSKVTEGYGLPEATPESLFVGKCAGVALVSIGVVCTCRLFFNTSVNVAVGVSLLPRILSCIHSLATDKPSQLSYPPLFDYANLVLFSVAAFTTLTTNTTHANIAVNVVALWTLVNGLALALDPTGFVGKLWGISRNDDLLAYLWKTVGYGFTLAWCLAFFLGNGCQ